MNARVVGLTDQVAWSVGNVAITVVAARALDPKSFGSFAFAFTYYLLALGMARALAAEPLLLRGRDRAEPHTRNVASAMAVLGVPAAALAVALGIVVGGVAGESLLALSLFLPMLFVEEACRFSAFAVERPGGALFIDVVWLGAQAVGLVVVLASGSDSAATIIAVWAGAGALAAVTGAIRSASIPQWGEGLDWIRANFTLGGPFLAEFLTVGGAAYIGLAGLAALSGLAAVGAVRVAQTVFGPINVLYMGVFLTLVPEGARHLARSSGNVRRTMAMASAVLASAALAWTAVVLVVPDSIGRAFFGASWPEASPVLIPMGLALCGGGFMAGAIAGLRALGAARLSLRTRLVTIPFSLGLPLAGAVVHAEVGFTVGLALSMWIGGWFWWAAFLRAHDAGTVPSYDGGSTR